MLPPRLAVFGFREVSLQRPEQQIHRAVAEHLRLRGVPGLLWWHTPNGSHVPGKRGRVQGGIQKAMGVRAGVSDIIALHQGKFFALELKAPGGKPTQLQLSFLEAVRSNGGFVDIAEGLEEALNILQRWRLLRGVVQ